MKLGLVLTGVFGAAIVMAVAAQNRDVDRGGPPSRLASALDADHDGVISAAEIRSSPSALQALDANSDKKLTADELRPAFGRGADGQGPFGGRRGRGDGNDARGPAPAASATELTDTLMAFDRNADGKLVRAEVPERFQGLFDRADGNKDGSLTRDELNQSASATVEENAGRGRGGRGGGRFGRGRGGPIDPLLRALDTDRDGVLAESEIAGAAEAITALDANHDGRLSIDEYRAAAPSPAGRDGQRR
jgi:Ca2+-binding EF-hand superfamily protein